MHLEGGCHANTQRTGGPMIPETEALYFFPAFPDPKDYPSKDELLAAIYEHDKDLQAWAAEFGHLFNQKGTP